MVIFGPMGERASIVYCVFYLKYAIFITLSHAACRAPVYADRSGPRYIIRAIISSFFFNFNTALISHVQGPGMDKIKETKSLYKISLCADTFFSKFRCGSKKQCGKV